VTDLLLVGGGLASVTVARSLRQRGDTRSITMVCAEAIPPYDRPPLSKDVLVGATGPFDTALLRDGDDLDVDLRIGVRAVALSPDDTVVALSDGNTIHASDIVIATGADARRIDAFGDGVCYLRTVEDAMALRARLEAAGSVVVIGGGFIGLEVAAAARALGREVTVLEGAPSLLARVLGESAGDRIAGLHRDRGVDIRCGCGVDRVAGNEVHLADGGVVPGDVIVVGVGVVPATEWLDGSGVTVQNGVVCDGAGRTSRAHVWAVGDVARWPNVTTGLHVRVEQWQAALDQAQVVAANLCGEPATWESVPYFWSDQYDHKIQFAGHSGHHDVVLSDNAIAYGDEDHVTGLLVIDNPRLLARGRKVIAQRGTIDDVRALVG
jgi:3-phenylpropionate/trans-cinnamate dioxygenase ferredoxin reductase subunit